MKDDAICILSIEEASVVLSGRLLLKNINLTINRGEHWAFVGQSGAGKTVLLNLIAGKHHVSTGKIEYLFLNENLRYPAGPLAGWRTLVAMVGSKHHFTNRAGINNIYYQQRFNSSDSEDVVTVGDFLKSIKSPDVSEQEIDGLRKRLSLEHLIDKSLIKLSNGESKRLRLAAALVKKPLLLLMDMPLTGLDVESRRGFDQLLCDIAESGITIVLTTSTFEIPSLVSHVGVLKNGELTDVLSRTAYENSRIKFKTKPLIDEVKLRSLLSEKPLPVFEHIIKMQNVSVRYGDKLVLDDINWQVAQGERWALQGRNGSGKSTLLSLINGDNPQAFANSIILFDRKKGSGESIWDIKKKIGFVSPELYQYFPSHQQCMHVVESGFHNTIGLFRPSSKALSELCAQWMEVFQISQYATSRLREVPASVQRLCLLARAMVNNPVLLLLDEPCQGFDIEQHLYFRDLISSICRMKNTTLIYVSHYSEEMPDCINRHLVLENGRVSDVRAT